MKTVRSFLVVLAVAGLFAGTAMAGNMATQTVTYQVQAINEISVSGDPAALVISTATAGSQPNDATNNSTTYNITTNETNKKITGEIDTAMPANTTLKVNLVAPTGGSSLGAVTLTASPASLVTGISTVAESSKTITYTFSATVSAGVISSDTRTVTLTLTDG